MIKEIKLIYSELEKRGDGTEEDPVRRVRQLYTHQGQLVAEEDLYGKNWIDLSLINK